MKKLYLLRHAKSSWVDAHQLDFDRPLNDRGLKDAPEMGKRLHRKNISPDWIVSSPAVRALATCRQIANSLGYPLDKIRLDRRLYLASDSQLLTVLKESANEGDPETVMMVGHNPGLTDFANRLLGDSIDNIPTCGIIGADLDITSWQEVEWGCGEQEFFDFPKHS